MRVVEPRDFTSKSRLKKSKTKRTFTLSALIIFFLCIFLITTSMLYVRHSQKQRINQPVVKQESSVMGAEILHEIPIASYPLKILSGDNFKLLYRSINYPNTQIISVKPYITGNYDADQRIRQIAEARGYRPTRIPFGPISKLDEEPIGEVLLQPLAMQSWIGLKAAAVNSGLPIQLTSAYRSPDDQRQLFMGRLAAKAVTPALIAAGRADAAVNDTLSLAAIPGYSRHHTGYTIDLWCNDGSTTFLGSSCFRWLSADNYKNAKEHGWIPSYPDGTGDQGPEPEPWEYVWVGDVAVRQR